MIKSSDKTRFLNIALAAVLATTVAASAYGAAHAADPKPQPASSAKASSGTGGGTSRSNDTSGWETVHRGKIKKVTIRTDDGEVGCHDHENQVSTPGPC